MNKLLEIALNFIGPSWRTSILGWVVILESIGGALTATAVFMKYALDNDVSTVADFAALTAAWKGVFIGTAFLFTRDNKVSSEAVKASGAEVK